MMEVKINTDDLKALLSDRDVKDFYYEKIKAIKAAFDANKHDEVKRLLDACGLF